MKPKLILCLALVLNGGLLGCSAIAQNSAKSDTWNGFPILPPITNANPYIRCLVSIRVPTKLKIERTTHTLSVEVDTNSFESTNITVGTNMIIGVQSACSVHLADDPFGGHLGRPVGLLTDRMGWGLCAGADFNLGKRIWTKNGDGVPQSGTKYVVEAVLAVFETDIPPQHEWSPYDKKFKIIWQRTLKQTVE
jgi:hypothetical protein